MVPPPFGVSDMAAALQLDKRKATELRDDLIGRGILNPVQQGLAIHHLIRKPLLRKVLEIYPAAFWQTYGQLVAHYQVSEGQSKRVQELNNYRLEVLRGVVEEIRKEAAPSAEK
jgi:hypothetical protein